MRDTIWRFAMINKLKRKFITLATVSTLVLMTALVGVMNAINYAVVVKDSDAITAVLMRMSENAPNKDNPFDNTTPPDDNTTGDATTTAAAFDDALSDNSDNPPSDKFPQGAGGNVPPGMSPEVPYESRFFTVTLSSDGNIVKMDFSQIMSVDKNDVDYYINKALSKRSEKGFVGQFRYAKKTTDTQTTLLFLDCGRKLDAFNSFLWTSIGVGFAGCVIVFAVFVVLSGKIVKPIAESYEKQKRFISDAGHEMKTPLTVINANLDLLEIDGKQSEELQDIRYQTKRLSELTNNLVYLSKMEESGHTLKKIEMPLSDIVSETISSFRTLAAVKNLDLSANIASDIVLCGSPDAIRQLTSILLDNAAKYSPAGGTVTIDLSSNKKNAVLTVFNATETRINKDDLPHVFDRFYRTDASRNSATGGHGIGLSIAKAIVGAHDGKIIAETKSGNDFGITATLPLKIKT